MLNNINDMLSFASSTSSNRMQFSYHVKNINALGNEQPFTSTIFILKFEIGHMYLTILCFYMILYFIYDL